MRRHLILILSLGLNLAVCLIWFATRHNVSFIHRRIPEWPASHSNEIHTVVVVRKQFFTWQQLESDDYQVYLNNLRDVGCPEETIRDIIVADVNELYGWRRLTEVTDPYQDWWRSVPDSNVVVTASTKWQALDQERNTLLKTLLNSNWETASMSLNSFVCLTGPVLGSLTPEVKHNVQDILSRSAQRKVVYQNDQFDMGLPIDPSAYYVMEQQTQSELAQVLNPAQQEEYQLRYSSAASSLRSELRPAGDVTADEFRSLFHLTASLQQQFQYALANPQTSGTNVTALAGQFYEVLKNVLGPERFQAYRAATDPVFRSAIQTAGAGASSNVVQSLYELKRTSQDEQNRILNDPSLSTVQKVQQLAALEQQEQIAGNQILGVPNPVPAAPLPPAPPVDNTPAAVHSYSPGETVDQIASQYGVSPAAVLNANPNVDFNHLSRGTGINIPRPPAQ